MGEEKKSPGADDFRAAVNASSGVNRGYLFVYFGVFVYLLVTVAQLRPLDFFIAEEVLELPVFNVKVNLFYFGVFVPILNVLLYAFLLFSIYNHERRVQKYFLELKGKFTDEESVSSYYLLLFPFFANGKRYLDTRKAYSEKPFSKYPFRKNIRIWGFKLLVEFVFLALPLILQLILGVKFLPFGERAIFLTHGLSLIVGFGVFYIYCFSSTSKFNYWKKGIKDSFFKKRYWELNRVFFWLVIVGVTSGGVYCLKFGFPYRKDLVVENAIIGSNSWKTEMRYSYEESLESSRKTFSDRQFQSLRLRNSKLFGLLFEDSRLEESSFENTTLSYCSFSNCDMTRVNFANNFLVGVGIDSSRVDSAVFRGVHAPGFSFTHSEGINSDFSAVNMSGASFDDSQLAGATFVNSFLFGSSFQSTRLAGVNFTRAELVGTNFQYAKLQGALFDHSDLRFSNFERANLCGAVFYKTDLRGCTFSSTNKSEIFLEGAVFIDCHFSPQTVFSENLGGDVWIEACYFDSTELFSQEDSQIVFSYLPDSVWVSSGGGDKRSGFKRPSIDLQKEIHLIQERDSLDLNLVDSRNSDFGSFFNSWQGFMNDLSKKKIDKENGSGFDPDSHVIGTYSFAKETLLKFLVTQDAKRIFFQHSSELEEVLDDSKWRLFLNKSTTLKNLPDKVSVNFYKNCTRMNISGPN